MFQLSENKNNHFLKRNLLRFLKCSICRRTPKRLERVCEDGHFLCEMCTLKHIFSKSVHRPCKKALIRTRGLTVFNSMLDVVLNTPVQSSKFVKNLEEVLECPVCYEETVANLNLCTSGHSLCSKCLTFIKMCPLCGGYIVPENGIVGIKRKLKDSLSNIPCCNHGCGVFSYYSGIIDHNDKCSFVSWSCGDEHCSWAGNVEKTSKHANEFHSTNILEGRKANMSLLMDNNIHLQLWNRKKNKDYKIIYKMTNEGLKLGVYCQKMFYWREVLMIYFHNGKKSHRYVVPYVEPYKNPSYFLTHECPTLVLDDGILGTSKPFLECLLQLEQRRSHAIMIFIIKAALMISKVLLF